MKWLTRLFARPILKRQPGPETWRRVYVCANCRDVRDGMAPFIVPCRRCGEEDMQAKAGKLLDCEGYGYGPWGEPIRPQWLFKDGSILPTGIQEAMENA